MHAAKASGGQRALNPLAVREQGLFMQFNRSGIHNPQIQKGLKAVAEERLRSVTRPPAGS